MENIENQTESYQTTFKCFNRYNKQGQRLSIFGEVNGQMLNMFILKCSTLDQFQKSVSEKVFNEFKSGNFEMYGDESTNKIKYTITIDGIDYHPIIFVIPIQDVIKPRHSFIEFCLENFYKMEKIERLIVTLQEEIILV